MQGLAGGQQGARRRVSGRAQVTGKRLAGVLGHGVRLSLHTGAAHGWEHRRTKWGVEAFSTAYNTGPLHTHTTVRLVRRYNKML